MQVPEQILKKLDVAKHVNDIVNDRFDRFPSLILDRCLSDCVDKLVEHTVSMFRSGHPLVSEILTMPRRGFGPRPVIVTPPSVRAMYAGLLSLLSDDLPGNTRSLERWEAHSRFGRPDESSGKPEYLVDIDIASCYEYIEHSNLMDELIMRTSDVPTAESLVELLGCITSRSRGLPQLSKSSDTLADAYLEIVERQLLRSGYEVSRVADDFKITAADWGTANAVIEEAAEHARNVGLVLSTEKTTIRKAATILQQETEEKAFLTAHFHAAQEGLTITDFFFVDYGVIEEGTVVPKSDDEVVIAEAFREIVREWYEGREDDQPLHARFLARALVWLADVPGRLADEWLQEIVFRQPIQLESVCRYLLTRCEHEVRDTWLTMDILTSMRRQSPWAKIWLLHVANQIPSERSCTESEVRDWARRQLNDKHEVVRAEAAWFLSRFNDVDSHTLGGLYSRATSLTRPALAATCGRGGFPAKSGVVKALTQDNKLTRAAHQWGESQAC